jgi:hypothetical protein
VRLEIVAEKHARSCRRALAFLCDTLRITRQRIHGFGDGSRRTNVALPYLALIGGIKKEIRAEFDRALR